VNRKQLVLALLALAAAVLLWLLLRPDGGLRNDAGQEPAPVEDAGSQSTETPAVPPVRTEAEIPGAAAGDAGTGPGAASGVIVTGVVRADREPREGVRIQVNGQELLSGLDGLFALTLSTLPATARFSLAGFTEQEVALSAEPMRVDLYSELNLAILVQSDFETRERITGTWRLIRNPVALSFARERDPPAPVTVLEGEFESDKVVLLPVQAGSSWHQRAYEVQFEAGARMARGYFGEVLQKYPEDSERKYRTCVIRGKQFQPVVAARVRFTDFDHAPLAARTVYVPTSHAIPRSWSTRVTDADGWIALELENSKLVSHFVIELSPGLYSAGEYGRVEERSAGEFSVLVPTRAPPIVLRGVLPDGSTVEIQRMALSEKSLQPRHDSSASYHEFTGEGRTLALDPKLDLHGWSSTYGQLSATLLPDRMTLPSVLYQWDDAATVLTLPDFHTLRLGVAGEGAAEAKLFLNVELQDGGRVWRNFVRSEAPIDLRLPSGTHKLTLLVAGTSTELASAECEVPAQSSLTLEILPALRLFVSIGGKPLSHEALVYTTLSGVSARARLDAGGSASLPGIDPMNANLNLLPQVRSVTVGETGSGILFLGHSVESLPIQSGEALLELPYGFLRVRNPSGAGVTATLRRNALSTGKLTLACPAGGSAEYLIPIGAYALDADSRQQLFEIASGQTSEIVLECPRPTESESSRRTAPPRRARW